MIKRWLQRNHERASGQDPTRGKVPQQEVRARGDQVTSSESRPAPDRFESSCPPAGPPGPGGASERVSKLDRLASEGLVLVEGSSWNVSPIKLAFGAQNPGKLLLVTRGEPHLYYVDEDVTHPVLRSALGAETLTAIDAALEQCRQHTERLSQGYAQAAEMVDALLPSGDQSIEPPSPAEALLLERLKEAMAQYEDDDTRRGSYEASLEFDGTPRSSSLWDEGPSESPGFHLPELPPGVTLERALILAKAHLSGQPGSVIAIASVRARLETQFAHALIRD
jgi:hypothetical protein